MEQDGLSNMDLPVREVGGPSGFSREREPIGSWKYWLKEVSSGTSLVVQWLSLHTPNAGGLGSILGQGTRSHGLQLKTLHAKQRLKILCAVTKTWPSQININKILLEHSTFVHLCVTYVLPAQSWLIWAEIIWPPNPIIFIIWPGTEKLWTLATLGYLRSVKLKHQILHWASRGRLWVGSSVKVWVQPDTDDFFQIPACGSMYTVHTYSKTSA